MPMTWLFCCNHLSDAAAELKTPCQGGQKACPLTQTIELTFRSVCLTVLIQPFLSSGWLYPCITLNGLFVLHTPFLPMCHCKINQTEILPKHLLKHSVLFSKAVYLSKQSIFSYGMILFIPMRSPKR